MLREAQMKEAGGWESQQQEERKQSKQSATARDSVYAPILTLSRAETAADQAFGTEILLFRFPLSFCLGPLMLVVLAVCSVSGNRSRPRTRPDDIFMNSLLELDESMPECSAAFRRVQQGERDAHSSYPPDLRGLWVSQEYVSNSLGSFRAEK